MSVMGDFLNSMDKAKKQKNRLARKATNLRYEKDKYGFLVHYHNDDCCNGVRHKLKNIDDKYLINEGPNKQALIDQVLEIINMDTGDKEVSAIYLIQKITTTNKDWNWEGRGDIISENLIHVKPNLFQTHIKEKLEKRDTLKAIQDSGEDIDDETGIGITKHDVEWRIKMAYEDVGCYDIAVDVVLDKAKKKPSGFIPFQFTIYSLNKATAVVDSIEDDNNKIIGFTSIFSLRNKTGTHKTYREAINRITLQSRNHYSKHGDDK